MDLSEREVNKGIVLEVTDKELLEKTGGIIQGMSGSPIIQNDKIIGAVTHVFVQDAKKGYGIFIENMLEHVKSWQDCRIMRNPFSWFATYGKSIMNAVEWRQKLKEDVAMGKLNVAIADDNERMLDLLGELIDRDKE